MHRILMKNYITKTMSSSNFVRENELIKVEICRL